MIGPAYSAPREVRPFDVELSSEERGELGRRFAECDDELDAAVEAESARKKQAREVLTAIRERKRAIRAAMRTGIERRQVVCEWQIDGGERRLVRTDTGEVVETQAQRVIL